MQLPVHFKPDYGDIVQPEEQRTVNPYSLVRIQVSPFSFLFFVRCHILALLLTALRQMAVTKGTSNYRPDAVSHLFNAGASRYIFLTEVNND